jgi:hypothetical protein
MYVAMLFALMIIFPIASIAIEALVHNHGVLSVVMLGKWFVFWAVGARLLIAGLRQIAQPRYTAEAILGVRDADATLIVRELGFANAAIGSVGVAGIFFAGWAAPLTVIGAIFYGLAGMNHALHGKRSKLQNAAMISDFFAAAVLVTICLAGGVAWTP